MRSEQAGQTIDASPRVGSDLLELLQNWSDRPIQWLARPTQTDKGGLAPGALRRVQQFVEEHLAESIDLAGLAKIAGLSTCHFARAFKQSVGVPPHRFVMLKRLDLAKELICRSNRPMAEIALEAGFADQSHFTRIFVAATGLTPRAFRKAHR